LSPAADYALEDGPSYLFNNRYNIPEQFGALYFGDRAEVCKATLEKRGLLASKVDEQVGLYMFTNMM